MPSVFLSHSSRDKPFVRNLAAHLRQHPELTVWFDETAIAPGSNIVTQISAGLDSEFVLFILSPDSVNSRWVAEEWSDAFWQQTNEGRIKLATVLYRDCPIPRLLRNKKYFDLRANHPEGFRQIATWLLTQQPAPPPRINPLPTRPPLFIGREADLAFLHTHLQPGVVLGLSGMPGRGKTTLALEFAHVYQTDFEFVYWLPCQSGSLASISSDLTRQLGLSLTGDLQQVVAELKNECARQRCLLVLDNVETEDPAALIPGGAASVLVTTRQPGLRFLRHHPELRLELFSENECFALFRQVIGAPEVDAHQSECRQLFHRVGFLPLAINLSAAAIKYDSYIISSLAANLPADVTALIAGAIAALPPDPRSLLAAMSACAPEGFRLSLAAGLVNLDEAASLDALRYLAARSLVDEIDRNQRRYRLHALVRLAADGRHLAQQHAEAVNIQFENWEKDWQSCEQDLPDFQLALSWALANGASFTQSLAFNSSELTRRIGRLNESFEICQRMVNAAEHRNDKNAWQAWPGNQALILQAWGQLDEALALHKKEEALCLELGKKDSLQRAYGNQALILQAWGRLDEALALHKKKEAICLELGKKDSLQRAYGNQALILQAWGQLDEALVLHKKEEALRLELGNKDSLRRSYGNQALILKAWGQLDEALALHKKEEALCLELGNKDGLQASYGNQALILQDWGRLDEALALIKKHEALCLELGNKDGLQASYGNQAIILRACGQLDEALALLQKKEALCLELGNKSGLAYCYWSLGLLARAQNDTQTEHEKLTAALALFTELKMPRERDEVAAELAQSRTAGAS